MYVSHQYSDFFKVLGHIISYKLIDYFGIDEVVTYKWIEHPLMIKLCAVSPDVCRWFLGPICEADPKVDDAKRMDVMIGHEPGGTSLMNLNHW